MNIEVVGTGTINGEGEEGSPRESRRRRRREDEEVSEKER